MHVPDGGVLLHRVKWRNKNNVVLRRYKAAWQYVSGKYGKLKLCCFYGYEHAGAINKRP